VKRRPVRGADHLAGVERREGGDLDGKVDHGVDREPVRAVAEPDGAHADLRSASHEGEPKVGRSSHATPASSTWATAATGFAAGSEYYFGKPLWSYGPEDVAWRHCWPGS
jgi:hypothetical protein